MEQNTFHHLDICNTDAKTILNKTQVRVLMEYNGLVKINQYIELLLFLTVWF